MVNCVTNLKNADSIYIFLVDFTFSNIFFSDSFITSEMSLGASGFPVEANSTNDTVMAPLSGRGC